MFRIINNDLEIEGFTVNNIIMHDRDICFDNLKYYQVISICLWYYYQLSRSIHFWAPQYYRILKRGNHCSLLFGFSILMEARYFLTLPSKKTKIILTDDGSHDDWPGNESKQTKQDCESAKGKGFVLILPWPSKNKTHKAVHG